jgi:hypothetical protein
MMEEAPAFRVVDYVRWDGDLLPLVEPAREFDDFLLFDREVCLCGVTAFARWSFPNESVEPVQEGETIGFTVRELLPGARMRMEIRWRRAL